METRNEGATENMFANRLGSVLVVGIALASAPATAAETGRSSGSLSFEKSEHVNSVRGTTRIVTRHVVGVSHARAKGGPLDEAQFHCHMTFVIENGRSPAQGSGYCHGIGGAGDTWSMLLSGGETGGTWSFVEGTGRYDMIKGNGTWRHEGSPDTNTERYEWAGGWTLKN